MVTLMGRTKSEVTSIDPSMPPPPPVQERPPPPPKEKEDQPAPVLITKQKQLSLAQIEMSLHPGMGDGVAGDYLMSFEPSTINEIDLIFNLGEVDRLPRVLYRVAPAYPYKLKEAGVTGTVLVMFVCTYKGRVTAAQVTSSPHVKLSNSSVRALRKWKFEPGIKDGRPVNVRMMIPFKYKVAARKW